ncbi:MAG TPA: helix-turn-helix transcriptional regulator [Gammaproteobacteria bacterium]
METHRRQLTDFLKGCRARLSPFAVGLPDTGRRRTPGLRREDIAALAGVSVTWYTWLEQGRDIHVSADVLERICAALRMSADEREYLFTLVQHRPAPLVRNRNEEVSPSIARMLQAIAVPAIAMTSRWDVIAWNDLTKIFRDYDKLKPEQRNLLRILLIEDETYQSDPEQYEAMARRVLAKFRVDYSQTPEDPAFADLIAELTARSPIFRRLWNSPDVMSRSEGVGRYPHLGGVGFEHSSYVPEGSPTLRVVIYVPHDEQSADKMAAWRAHVVESQARRKRSTN